MRRDAALCAVRPLAAYGVDLMSKVFQFVAARLSEPTTWRGLLFIGTSAGIVLRPELQNAVVAAGMALAGLIGVLVPDPSAGLARSDAPPATPTE